MLNMLAPPSAAESAAQTNTPHNNPAAPNANPVMTERRDAAHTRDRDPIAASAVPAASASATPPSSALICAPRDDAGHGVSGSRATGCVPGAVAAARRAAVVAPPG